MLIHRPSKSLIGVKSALRHFFSVPRSKLETFKRIARACIIAIPTVGTLPLTIGVNESLAKLNLVPNPVDTQNHKAQNNLDNFVLNFPGSEKITEAILRGEIDQEKLDINTNGRILDTTPEYENLITQLQKKHSESTTESDKIFYEEVINLLTTLKELNKHVWGENGINSDKIFQVDNECAIISDVIGSALTEQNIQDLLKANLRITSFDLSGKEPKIDFEVTIGGKRIQIPSYTLNKYRDLYRFDDSVRGPSAIVRALEKELDENYIIDSLRPLASSSTLLTNEKYYTIPLALLSDEALEQILKTAPNKIIKIGTFYPETEKYLRLGSHSSVSTPQIYKGAESGLLLDHSYVVKSYSKNNDNNTTYTLKDGSGEYSLTKEEIRRDGLYISAPATEINQNILDKRAIALWLTAILAATLLTKLVNKIEKNRVS